MINNYNKESLHFQRPIFFKYSGLYLFYFYSLLGLFIYLYMYLLNHIHLFCYYL